MNNATPIARFPALAPEAMTPEQLAVADALISGPRGGIRDDA